jgi:hypothetical protein
VKLRRELAMLFGICFSKVWSLQNQNPMDLLGCLLKGFMERGKIKT